MNNSLCAHCVHCDEIKYDGFMCDNTGYLENKSVCEGCKDFRPDTFTGLVKKCDNAKLKQITEWLKDNVFRNYDVMFLDGDEAYPGGVHVVDIIASLHNLLYEQITGERYNYMFHWANKIGSDTSDNIFDGNEIGYKGGEE